MIPEDAPLGLAHEALRGFAVALLAACAVAAVAVAVAPVRGRGRRLPPWLVVGAAALALRAAVSLVQDGAVFDVLVAYRSIGDRVLHGVEVWQGDTESLATYPPTVYGWWAVAALVPGAHPHVFAALVRIPFWVADAGIAVALTRLLPGPLGTRAGWVYALCPVAVAVPTLHGQHDPTTALLLLPAVVMLQRGRAGAAGLLTGAGTALKQWPVYFLLPLLAALPRRRIPLFLAAVAAPPLLAFAGYGVLHPHDAVHGFLFVATYRPHRQGLGTSLLFPDDVPAGIVIAANIAVTAGAGVLAALLVRAGWSPAQALALDMLLVVGLSPTVSDQYLMWAFPFLLLAGRLRTAAFLGAALLPAVVSLDMWTAQGDGDTPRGFLVLATLATLASAAWLLRSGRTDLGRVAAPAQRLPPTPAAGRAA